MTKEVEIVGAGLAGLVAGINLTRQGYRVKIHEGRKYMGGDLSYADSTLLDVPLLQAELGVEIGEALEPWTLTRAWSYGKKYEFGLPRGVEGYTVERGKGENSLENVLYRQAREMGVEVILGSKLSKAEIKELQPGSIIATGLDREAFEAMNIPCRPFFCHMATGRGDPSRPSVIIYLDSFTREFGYYFQRGEAAGALVFSVQRPLTDGEKEDFKNKLSAGDGIEFDNWNDGIASYAAWPLGSWNNRRLLQGDKILAGTLAGLISPVLLFGVNGALVSGKIAATAVTDRDRALAEFRRLAPLYYPQFAFRKFREYAPHAILKPLTRALLSTYHPDNFPYLMLFALWPPGYRKERSL
jgi:flavin-dependent dehydrogenase